jgi:uncharacterized membrane protein
MKTKSFLRILITSFACAVIGVTPWLFIYKFIIKVDSSSVVYYFLFAFIMMWFACTVGFFIGEKPEKQREQISEKFAIVWSKSYAIYVSIVFVIVIALLILALSKIRM